MRWQFRTNLGIYLLRALLGSMSTKLDKDELLIYGYCRSIQPLLNQFNNTIPDGIIMICLTFYPKIEILTWSNTYKGSHIVLTDDNKCAAVRNWGEYVMPNYEGISSGVHVFRIKVCEITKSIHSTNVLHLILKWTIYRFQTLIVMI